jgi:AraC family transcriptional regulator
VRPVGIQAQQEGTTQRVGLRVELRTGAAGVVEPPALSVHLLVVHAGTPTRVACRDHRAVYTRGDLDIIPVGLSDVWEQHDASTSLDVRLAPSLLRRAAGDAGVDPDRAGPEPRYHFRDARIEHIAWALDAERQADSPSGLLYVEGLGLALAAHLLRQYPAPLRVRGGLSKHQLRRLTGYIEKHLDEDLSLWRLGGIAGVSASHLKTLFRRSTGPPVHQYVVQRRCSTPRRCSRAASCRLARWRLKRASRTRVTWRDGCDAYWVSRQRQ